jgi:hypothetical protein
MSKMIQVQNPHTGNWESILVNGLPDPQPTPPPVIRMPQQLPRQHNGHPLLIIGIVIGALIGLIACLPPKLRGFAVLAILAGIIWLFWTGNHDRAAAQAYTGTQQPVPAHYSDYAPRAELVRLPNK